MDLRHLGISEVAQATVDGAFLDAVVSQVTAHNIKEDTKRELEAVFERSHAEMGASVVEGREVAREILCNLGKLSFLDTHGICIEVRDTPTLFQQWRRSQGLESGSPKRRLFSKTFLRSVE